MIKLLAINSVPKRHDIGTETVRKIFKDAYTQTDNDYIYSPIMAGEHLDWFDVDTTDNEDSSFDIEKFEQSLRFPERSYTLGAIINEERDDDSDMNEATIDRLVEKWGKGMAKPSEDSRGFHSFLDVSDTGVAVKSIRDELREVGEYEEESIDQSGKIIYESEGPCEDNYSPPKTRSRGSVPEFSNVQGKIIEYGRRTEARRRTSTRD